MLFALAMIVVTALEPIAALPAVELPELTTKVGAERATLKTSVAASIIVPTRPATVEHTTVDDGLFIVPWTELKAGTELVVHLGDGNTLAAHAGAVEKREIACTIDRVDTVRVVLDAPTRLPLEGAVVTASGKSPALRVKTAASPPLERARIEAALDTMRLVAPAMGEKKRVYEVVSRDSDTVLIRARLALRAGGHTLVSAAMDFPVRNGVVLGSRLVEDASKPLRAFDIDGDGLVEIARYRKGAESCSWELVELDGARAVRLLENASGL